MRSLISRISRTFFSSADTKATRVFDRPTKEQKKALAKWMKKYPTPAESVLWRQIKDKRLGVEFGRQVRLCGYILDFACHKHKLCVELDGAVHDSRKDYDARRDYRLEMIGWKTLRFENERVFSDLSFVLNRICDHLGVPYVEVKKATAKQKRRLADRIAGRTKRSQAMRWNKLAARPVDMTPRLVKTSV
jgi:very-short-patch-repair endonuclease